jgi:N6-adenosine-specific RNA methylase IME4
MSSCILYQNAQATITVIDIPRSIEQAQSSSLKYCRLISSKPLEYPYPSVEPKSAKAKANVAQTSLEDLLLLKHLEFALDEVKGEYGGPWYLPRATGEDDSSFGEVTEDRKRLRLDLAGGNLPSESLKDVEADHVQLPQDCSYFHNSHPKPLNVLLRSNNEKAVIPSNSTFLNGEILGTVDIFRDHAPKFDLIILDPPWPNRSARRKQSYNTSYGNSQIRSLLKSLPLYDHLVDDGYVAVWITNKPSFREMILGEGGLFEEWGVQLVEEWIWLKLTSNGVPICGLDSTWRKPYEVLLVGRRGRKDGDIQRRVIVGVPDLHSRKPNLKALFESRMGKVEVRYEALEIFARNLIAGWWSWGNEVLKFQTSEHWAER